MTFSQLDEVNAAGARKRGKQARASVGVWAGAHARHIAPAGRRGVKIVIGGIASSNACSSVAFAVPATAPFFSFVFSRFSLAVQWPRQLARRRL